MDEIYLCKGILCSQYMLLIIIETADLRDIIFVFRGCK